MGGRAPSRSAAVAACGDESGGKICGGLAPVLMGLFQFAHFTFKGTRHCPRTNGGQRLVLLGLFSRYAATLAGINFDLVDSFVQRLRRAAKLR